MPELHRGREERRTVGCDRNEIESVCNKDTRVNTHLSEEITMSFLPPSIRFALVGVSNTALSLSVIWCALKVFGWSDVPANVVGYLAGFVWSFMWNRSWTFRHRGPVVAGLVRFAIVCAVAYGVNLLVLIGLTSHFGAGSFWTQVVAMGAYTVVSFVGSRHFAFPSSSAELIR